MKGPSWFLQVVSVVLEVPHAGRRCVPSLMDCSRLFTVPSMMQALCGQVAKDVLGSSSDMARAALRTLLNGTFHLIQ